MSRPIQQLWNDLESLQNQQAEELRLYASAEPDSAEAQAHWDEAQRCEGGIAQLMDLIRERTTDEEQMRANASAAAPAPRPQTFGEAILGARDAFNGLQIGFHNTATVVHPGRPVEFDPTIPGLLASPLLGGFAATLEDVDTAGASIMFKQRGTQTGHPATWGGVTDGNSATKQMVLFDWADKTANCEVVAGYVPISKQSLNDYDTLMSTIQSDLLIDLGDVTDGKYLTGNNASGIVGIHNTTGIQAFTTGMGGMYYDAIRKMRTLVLQNARRVPTYVAVNPLIKEAIDLYKTTTNLYQTLGDADKYWGMTIVEDFNEDGIMVYDNRAAKIRTHGAVSVEVGYVNDQFIKNELCLLAEHEKALQVVYPNAFCYASKTDLDKAAS